MPKIRATVAIALGGVLFVCAALPRRDEPTRTKPVVRPSISESTTESPLVSEPPAAAAGQTPETRVITCGDEGKEMELDPSAETSEAVFQPSPSPLPQTPQTVRTLLYIRVAFADDAEEPLSAAAAQEVMDQEVSPFLAECSYGRLSLQTTVTPVVVLPGPRSYYENNYTRIWGSAPVEAAKPENGGYDLRLFHYEIIAFKRLRWSWNGMASIGGKGVLLNGRFGLGITAHELGHNFGLGHAASFTAYDPSGIGRGISQEYGNPFDVMGLARLNDVDGYSRACHYNAWAKNRLGWLDFQTVSSNGIYRVAPLESPVSESPHALRVAGDYWIEFRQGIPSNPWLVHGAVITRNGLLLDQSPLTVPGHNGWSWDPRGIEDAPLPLGRTFSPRDGIYITPLRKTATGFLEVEVRIGSTPGNLAPSLVMSANRTSVPPNTDANFTAVAEDANGDPLAFSWDFGDGSVGPNEASAAKRWSLPGDYVVRCIVSDRRGGVASASIVVTVGARRGLRIRGQVTAGGTPIPNVLVACARPDGLPPVRGSRPAVTDSDGTYCLVDVLPDETSIRVDAFRHGWAFTPAGFANPIAAATDLDGVDFAARPTPLHITVRTPLSGRMFYVTSRDSITGGSLIGNVDRPQGVSLVSLTWSNLTTGAGGSARIRSDRWWDWVVDYRISLSPGENVVRLTARDQFGRSETAEYRVLSDRTAPTVRITTPSPSAWTTPFDALEIGGSAADDRRLSRMAWSNAATGEEGPIGLTADGTWSATIPVALGQNAVRVRAWDMAGNEASASMIISKIVDSTPPVLTITSPTSGSECTTDQAVVTVGGRVFDDLSGVVVEWNVGNDSGTTSRKGPTHWWASVPLRIGINRITVTARDPAGNRTTVRITITRRDGFPRD